MRAAPLVSAAVGRRPLPHLCGLACKDKAGKARRCIVDRLVRFDAVYTENKKIKKHYGKIIDALKDIMDGHLL